MFLPVRAHLDSLRGTGGGGVLRFKRVEHAWNTRRIIRQNPRKVRGVHALRGKVASLMVYYYSCFFRTHAWFGQCLYRHQTEVYMKYFVTVFGFTLTLSRLF